MEEKELNETREELNKLKEFMVTELLDYDSRFDSLGLTVEVKKRFYKIVSEKSPFEYFLGKVMKDVTDKYFETKIELAKKSNRV